MVRAVFFGSDQFSVPILQLLLSRGPSLPAPVETVAVVTQPDRPAGRGRKTSTGPVKVLALEHELAVAQPARLREPHQIAQVLELAPEIIVVAAYGLILPRGILQCPRYGCLNLHPSILPLYRGPSPVAGSILDGRETTGTTLMLMEEKMDAGPILAQSETRIGPAETTGELTSRLADLSAELLMSSLPRWLDGTLAPVPQDESRATYTRLLTVGDRPVDWSLPAETLARRVRALNPWPVATTSWRGRTLRLLRSGSVTGLGAPGKVLDLREGRLLVGTGRGLLAVGELQLEGGRSMTASDLVRGHPALLGAVLGS